MQSAARGHRPLARRPMVMLSAMVCLAQSSAQDLSRAELEAVHCGESDQVAFCLTNVHDSVTEKIGLDHAKATPCHQKFVQLQGAAHLDCRVKQHSTKTTDDLRHSLKNCLHCVRLLHFATSTPAPTPPSNECEVKCAMHVNNKFKKPIFTSICRKHKGKACSIRPWMDTFHSDDDAQSEWKEADLPLAAVGETCYCMNRCRLGSMVCGPDGKSVAEKEIVDTYKESKWLGYPLFLLCTWSNDLAFQKQYCSDKATLAKKKAEYDKKYPALPSYCADGQKSRATYIPNADNGEYVATYKCSMCDAGTYSQPGLGVHDRQSFCIDCPHGKFGVDSGMSDCKWCNPHGCGNIPGFPSKECAQDKFCKVYVQDPTATDISKDNQAIASFAAKTTLPPTPIGGIQNPVEEGSAGAQKQFEESEYQAFVERQRQAQKDPNGAQSLMGSVPVPKDLKNPFQNTLVPTPAPAPKINMQAAFGFVPQKKKIAQPSHRQAVGDDDKADDDEVKKAENEG